MFNQCLTFFFFYPCTFHEQLTVFTVFGRSLLWPLCCCCCCWWCFEGYVATCGGDTCQLWAGFIKTEEAWIHLSDRPRTSLLIAPSSGAARSSNWQNVGVDGIKMAAVVFTSMTACCQLCWREEGVEVRRWEGEGALCSVTFFFFSVELRFCVTQLFQHTCWTILSPKIQINIK